MSPLPEQNASSDQSGAKGGGYQPRSNSPLFGAQPSSDLVAITYIAYGLHLFSAVTGLLTPALVLTAFLTGWPSLIAVLLCYLKRGEAEGSYLESHFSWLLRSFWFALLWLAVAGLLFVTVIGIPLALLVFGITGLWILYRLIRGLLRLMDKEAMPEH